MTLPLERTIMKDCGLADTPEWHIGSSTSALIRKQAVKLLPSIIYRAHRKDPDAIHAPVWSLLAFLRYSVLSRENMDGNTHSLTLVWEATSYIVAHHIRTANDGRLIPSGTAELLEKLEGKYGAGGTFPDGFPKDLGYYVKAVEDEMKDFLNK